MAKKRQPLKKLEKDIEHFKWQYEQTRGRYKTRLAIEWRIVFTAWTALLAATGYVEFNKPDLPWGLAFVLPLLVLVIAMAAMFFEKWVAERQLKDSRLGYWYFSAIDLGVTGHPRMRNVQHSNELR